MKHAVTVTDTSKEAVESESRPCAERASGVRLVLQTGLVAAVILAATARGQDSSAPGFSVTVQAEEKVYSYTDAKNGAGPMWCSGSSCLVRAGDQVIASGLETVTDVPPLNNCRWVLWGRATNGWQRLRSSVAALTREPCPIVLFDDERLLLSSHPTLAPGQPSGPARPEVLEFKTSDWSAPREAVIPEWAGRPLFTEHSYRSFAADAANQELILFVNEGNWLAHWAFLDRTGKWSARGELRWPWGADYARPQPIRICYPNVLLRNREVHFAGVSDIVEPRPEWRAFKRELTGQEWDYDFRRLYYTRIADIRTATFDPWTEVASRESTCGWITPGDLWLDDEGLVHLVWYERAIDERLREKFFPQERQSHAIMYARLNDGRIEKKLPLVLAEEGQSREVPANPRFHLMPDGRMYVVFFVGGTDAAGKPLAENRMLQMRPNGTASPAVTIPLKHPLRTFFTASPRAGSKPSPVLDLLGQREGAPFDICYAQVRVH